VSVIHGIRAKVLAARRAWSEPSTQSSTVRVGRAERMMARGARGRCAEMSHSAVLPRPSCLSRPAPRGPMASSPASVNESRTSRGSASAMRCSTFTSSLVVSSRRGVGGSQGWAVDRSVPTGAPSGGLAAVTTEMRHPGHRWLLIQSQTTSAAAEPSSPKTSRRAGVFMRTSFSGGLRSGLADRGVPSMGFSGWDRRAAGLGRGRRS
jgi:hypothetical protein